MHQKIISIVALLAFTASACATNQYQPIIDEATSDPLPGHTYLGDLEACQTLADQRNTTGDAVAGTAAGAAIGALFGTLIGAWTGNVGHSAAVGASGGALGGGLSSSAGSVAEQRATVRNCMTNRGWSVVGK